MRVTEIHIESRLLTHPKILIAGGLLGGDYGPLRVFWLYVAALGFSREHLTDGFVPDEFVQTCGLVQTPQAVANVLCSRRVRLWRKVRGGFQIHDYFHYNQKGAAVREIRAKWRDKKAAQRASRNGRMVNMSPGESPGDSHRAPVRARGTYQVPGTRDGTLRVPLKSTSTGAARGSLSLVGHGREEPTFALACVLMREAFLLTAGDRSVSNTGEAFKELCARRGLRYDSVLVRKAFDAVQVARARRSA
jgi:hypothetical protein